MTRALEYLARQLNRAIAELSTDFLCHLEALNYSSDQKVLIKNSERVVLPQQVSGPSIL